MMKSELVEEAVAQGIIPPRLFKYRGIDDKALGIIETASIWFANPLDFNDPFDFQIEDTGAYSNAEIIEYLQRRNVSAADIDRILASGLTADKVLAIVEKAKATAFARKGVLCLSGVPDAMLMWSHYSNGHAGLAFELDVLSDPAFFVSPVKAIYTDDYPLTRYLVDGGDAVIKCVRSKAKAWQYEEEVRIVKNATGLHTFKREVLTGVYVGCRASSSDIDLVSQALAKGGYEHTTLYQASRRIESYGITFRKL